MELKKRVVIAEDHPIFREGLRSLLSGMQEFEIVGEAADGLEAVECVERLQPDLLLIDLSMPRMSGVEAIQQIKSRAPETKTLALTVHKDEEYIVAALEAGVDGYVLKDANRSELIGAIQTVLEGKPYLSPAVSEKVIKGYLKGLKKVDVTLSDTVLTEREQEVLRLIAGGMTNKTIADQLFISIKTVERHRANIMTKLNLHTPQGLTLYAIEKGIINP